MQSYPSEQDSSVCAGCTALSQRYLPAFKWEERRRGAECRFGRVRREAQPGDIEPRPSPSTTLKDVLFTCDMRVINRDDVFILLDYGIWLSRLQCTSASSQRTTFEEM